MAVPSGLIYNSGLAVDQNSGSKVLLVDNTTLETL
jgi:hypothetical protein